MQDLPSSLANIDVLLSQAAEGGIDPSDAAPLIPALARDGLITRQGPRWHLSGTAGCVIGLDLGGTKLCGALSDLSGRVLAEATEPTRHEGEKATADQLAGMVQSLRQAAGNAAGDLRAVGLGVPGFVSVETGHVTLSPNLALSPDFHLDRHLANLLGGCPVLMENDVNVAALGEYWRGADSRRFLSGAGKPADDGSLAFLSLGTGVGLGLMLGGRNVRGASGGAGEIAYMPAGVDPFAAARTSFGGAYEDIVGSPGIRNRYGDESITVREIFDRAARGEATAMRVIDDTARQVAVGVATIITLLDPSAVVLGGGIGTRQDFGQLVADYTTELAPIPPRIAISGLGRRAGVVGAVMKALLEIRQALLAKDTSNPGPRRPGETSHGLASPEEHAELATKSDSRHAGRG